MDKVFTQIYFRIKNRRKLFFLTVVLFVAAFVYLGFHIDFEEDITKTLPKGEKTNITAKVIGQLNFSDKIVVMIKARGGKNKQNLGQVAQTFLDSIARDSIYYTDVKGKIGSRQIDRTFDFVYRHLPLFLDKNDYKKINNRLGKDSINKQISDDYHNLISPTGMVSRNFILKDPLGLAFIGLKKLRKLGLSKDFTIKNGFIHTADGSTLLLFITPKYPGTDTKRNEKFVNHLKHYQNQINQNFKGTAKLTYFGTPFVALANARQIKHDIQNTVFISLGILMLILIFFYRQIYVPLILFIPALCGASFALAVLYFTHDSISAISISVGAILIGITIDYPLHIITHFRENPDIGLLYKSVAKPILASSCTTALAFLCLVFVNSEVLNDLGVFAAITVVVSAVSALVIIPHLYIPKTTAKKTVIDKIAGYKFEKNKLIIVLALITIIIGAFSFSKVKFDNDLEHLNFVPKAMKASQKQFENLGSIGGKSIYLSVYGNSNQTILDKNHQVRQQLDQLKKEGLIEDFTSVGNFVLSKEKQIGKINRWETFWTPKKTDSTLGRVQRAASDLGFNKHTFQGLPQLLTKNYQPIPVAEYKKLSALQLDQFYAQKDGFYTISSMVMTDSTHRKKVIEKLGQAHVAPIDRKYLNEQFLGQIRDDFKTVANYSFIVVFLILLLFFRRLELALLGIVPIIITGFVTTGLIYIFGFQLNVFSTIVTTLIIGLGVDFSIFMTMGLRKRYTTGKDELRVYRTSIILAVLTTMLTLGVLVFAKHPALKSISVIALIGILSAMLITFTFYPILFRFFIEKRPEKGKSPISLRLFVSSVISFGYFSIGSLLLSVFAMVFFPLIPIKKEKKMKGFRAVISSFFKSVMYSNFMVKKRVANPHHETFEKPAIIIANHSSSLDILSLGFLPVPFIILVKDWVYRSPIFGKVVKKAGYYPVSEGLENGKEKLLNVLKDRTSLSVFPEGTRSRTGAINRFHKGAFLLAQNYHIDIVPLYIHGNSDLLPKGDFIIFDGEHYLEIGKRIRFGPEKERENTKAITKKISSDFKGKFQQIRNKKEGALYFKKKIHLNFLYKTDEVVAQAHREFNKNATLYDKLNFKIGNQSTVLRLGDDLGIWDLMLTLQQARRKVFTFIADKKKRAIAEQGYLLKKRKITYLDRPQHKNADCLLITTKTGQQIISGLVNAHRFKTIILLSDTIPLKVFSRFGYQTTESDNDYYILKSD